MQTRPRSMTATPRHSRLTDPPPRRTPIPVAPQRVLREEPLAAVVADVREFGGAYHWPSPPSPSTVR